MDGSRFSEGRTLVRRITRLPDQDPKLFKENVRRLKRHFEQFTLDVSELCQWLMALRPGGKKDGTETKIFWKFFLESGQFLTDKDKNNSDCCRRMAFDAINGLENSTELLQIPLSQELRDSFSVVAALDRTRTANGLFKRIGGLSPIHRQILLKATAEWVMARYWRGHENQIRRHEEWQKEKDEWEKAHPCLTKEKREAFTGIFKELGIKDKKARICTWERLKGNEKDCDWAGVRIGKNNHNGYCKKYKEFVSADNNIKKFFPENADIYLKLRLEHPNKKQKDVFGLLPNECRQGSRFIEAWPAYLNKLGVRESTILEKGALPHCISFGNKCTHNRHTEKCESYRAKLAEKPDLQPLEEEYREWRREYLAGPSKPSFRYPSAKDLPIPKIFGKNYFNLDFDRSVLSLRLDDMPEGEFISFGFVPWPKDYNPQPKDMELTSVHINFVGTRARAGFRFDVRHLKSRFGVAQDEIAELRSQTYPRKSQDQLFLNDARRLLYESFKDGEPGLNLKFLTVDLGTSGGAAALFTGKTFSKAIPLEIVKIEKLHKKRPGKENGDKSKDIHQKGLNEHHVGKHLNRRATEARKIAKARDDELGELRGHDLRRLTLHTRWMIRDWARLNASQIVKEAEKNKADLIVFESLRGWKLPGYDTQEDAKKRRLSFFAHGIIRKKVTKKAVERGMRVVTVPYLKSSQFCSECEKEQNDKKKWNKNKNEHHFQCEHKGCGHKCNSDENAARVIGKVFLGEINLPVDQKKLPKEGR